MPQPDTPVPSSVKPARRAGWVLRPVEFALKWGLLGAVAIGLMTLAGRAGWDIKVDGIFGQQISMQQKTEKITGRVEDSEEQLANLEDRVTQLTENLAVLTAELSARDEVTSITPQQVRDLPSEQGAITEPLFEVEPVNDQGVIWIGTWNDELGEWTDGTIAGQQALPPPDQLVDKSLPLAMRVNVRADFPAAPEDGYYRAISSKGISVENSKVRIISEPRAYLRGSGVQYWAKVDATYEPKQAAKELAQDN